ncbi:UNVERIFIED_ORG: hypothetical protein J2806_004687 [Kosakonia oryzae]|uniref:RelE toxin of RelE / RelB toxin-antitoxin system n=1 Tax=Kosakonia radicincitans TaxID=283686 RepID=A0AAX2EYN5_9ENTR|nr:type II toxin-antitoxin system RelE/ParE family toxin [Kosakonia radicincitans]MDP9568998.1 hypothetical protein [Kosakonia oryzae]SFF34989.1 hypothetical protein SAMN03159468_04816 [Kosakonia radicincitans]SFR25461.1 hypothetical protein SAMN03159514_04654 [Kosakonia radicincitans]SFU14072.1 hypothetical protein SAMN03159428_04594 [Kosakonia radicincitans]SFY22124.1 hypothetical protein SAMN03159436_04315 [Kosakonia radicincitans]
MSIYVLKAFDKNTKGDGIDDATLCEAAQEVISGKYEASLGGGVFKKRIPLPGTGKSGGARAVIAFKTGKHLFFLNGYAKSATSSNGKEIPDDVLKAYRKFAADLFGMTQAQIDAHVRAETMREVKCDG